MSDLIHHTILNIDRSLCALDQGLILTAIETALLLTEHLKEHPVPKPEKLIEGIEG